MIILVEQYGRLCNRLFMSAYGIALAEASDQTLVNLSLAEYRDLFPATRPVIPLLKQLTEGWIRQSISGVKRFRATKPYFVHLSRENASFYSPDNAEFIAATKRRPFTIIQGWPDPSRISFPRETSRKIRKAFSPNLTVRDTARAVVRRAREGVDVLVGLHIRLTDYRTYRHGIFYYCHADYQRALERMTDLLPGYRVGFLICSDEPQKAEAFAPFRVALGPGTTLGDLYSLAGCDYLMGPPSTYSLWAAFYGQKLLYHMVEPEPPCDLSTFQVPDGNFQCIDLRLDDETIERRRRLRGTLSSELIL
jgi:hypothetical protein